MPIFLVSLQTNRAVVKIVASSPCFLGREVEVMEEEGGLPFLAPEVWRHILSCLPDRDMFLCSTVCKAWRIFVLDLLRGRQNTKPQEYQLKMYVDKALPSFSKAKEGHLRLLEAYQSVLRRMKNDFECLMLKEVKNFSKFALFFKAFVRYLSSGNF